LSIENIVVHGVEASISLLFGVELKISVTKRFACFLMEDYFSALESETLTGKQFEEIKVEEVLLGKIADIETGELVLLFLADWS
jgi:hypothetical protein